VLGLRGLLLAVGAAAVPRSAAAGRWLLPGMAGISAWAWVDWVCWFDWCQPGAAQQQQQQQIPYLARVVCLWLYQIDNMIENYDWAPSVAWLLFSCVVSK
jgi:hypothetical protein